MSSPMILFVYSASTLKINPIQYDFRKKKIHCQNIRHILRELIMYVGGNLQPDGGMHPPNPSLG
jgi:hypothetical protein